MSFNNRIRPIPPSLGSSKKTIKPRAATGTPGFFEKDLPLQGIIKETNNYPVGTGGQAVGISYYDPLDYYDTEGGSSYFEIIY
jgi:hypothetical protein